MSKEKNKGHRETRKPKANATLKKQDKPVDGKQPPIRLPNSK